jgi:hypothetical protein
LNHQVIGPHKGIMIARPIAPALAEAGLASPFPDDQARRHSPWGLPELCAIVQVAGPAILYLSGIQVFRLPLRFSVFGIGLLSLILCVRRGRVARLHPAWKMLAIAGPG